MRWKRAIPLTVEDFTNLAQGRIIEHVVRDQRVPIDDDSFLDFQVAFKVLGTNAYIGFHDQQPYVLKYWIPV